MNATKSILGYAFLILASWVMVACVPEPATPMAPVDIQVTNIVDKEEIYGEIIQTRVFNQCDANSSFKAEVQFSDSSGESRQKELVVTGGVTIGAGLSGVAKAELEGTIQEHFSVIKSTLLGHQESASIEVPAFTRQEYTIVWKEIRRVGTIEYTENGVEKVASYDYRIGIELGNVTGRNIDCHLPTSTPEPTQTPIPPTVTDFVEPSPLPRRTLKDGCIFAKTWKADSTDPGILASVVTDAYGCHSMESMGIFVGDDGKLNLSAQKRRTAIASGIYTSISNNSVIEFKVFVNSMYLVYEESPADLVFAIAPASDPMTTRNMARFKLHVETSESKPLIYFMMADVGENTGIKVPDQHYEYGRTYTIRFELSGSVMNVYINNLKMKESLLIPDGQKVFYVGYSLPVLAGADALVTDVTVDGVLK